MLVFQHMQGVLHFIEDEAMLIGIGFILVKCGLALPIDGT